MNEAGIGQRVRAARTRQNLSREELAVRSGLSWSAIAQIETGRRTNLRPSTLVSLAQVLDVTLDYLAGQAGAITLLEHRVLVYGSDEELMVAGGSFLSEALERDEPALVVMRKQATKFLKKAVGAPARKLTFASNAEWYSAPAAALTAYRRFAEDALDQGAHWVSVLAELPIWTGRSDADIRLWTQYEALVNLAFGDLPVTIVCAYDSRALPPELLERAYATHCEFLRADGIEQNQHYVDPAEFILAR
jgi:transcriptional regulator with XRE-family HTH domain